MKMSLDLHDPNFLIQHRCGVLGLYQCLNFRKPTAEDLVSWSMEDNILTLEWDCTDKEAFNWLLTELCPIREGLISPLNYSADLETRVNFTTALRLSLYESNKTRILGGANSVSVELEEGLAPQTLTYYEIKTSQLSGLKKGEKGEYHRKVFKKCGSFNLSIPIKSTMFPGADATYLTSGKEQTLLETPEGFLALAFMPLGCGFQKARSHVVVIFPEVCELTSLKTARSLKTRSYALSGTLPESAMAYALEEKLQQRGIGFVECYALGKESAKSNQKVKLDVKRLDLDHIDLEFFTLAKDCLPGSFKESKNPKAGQSSFYASPNRILGLIAENLTNQRGWYAGYSQLVRGKTVYYRRQIGDFLKMATLTEQEQLLIDAIKGAQSRFIAQQINKEVNFDGLSQEVKNKFFERCLNKSRYRLQRPMTQRAFSKAFTQFLSQYNVKFGNVTKLYPWLNSANWRSAQDLALLALVSSAEKTEDPEVEEEEVI